MEKLIQFVEENIENNIKDFTRRKDRMFNIVRGYKYPIVFLTSLSTIVLGLELGDHWVVDQKNIALVIGAVVTALTTLMAFWNAEEYWLKNKIIELQLKSLKAEFLFEKASGLSEKTIKDFFERIQNITGQQESLWKVALDNIDEKNDQ